MTGASDTTLVVAKANYEFIGVKMGYVFTLERAQARSYITPHPTYGVDDDNIYLHVCQHHTDDRACIARNTP